MTHPHASGTHTMGNFQKCIFTICIGWGHLFVYHVLNNSQSKLCEIRQAILKMALCISLKWLHLKFITIRRFVMVWEHELFWWLWIIKRRPIICLFSWAARPESRELTSVPRSRRYLSMMCLWYMAIIQLHNEGLLGGALDKCAGHTRGLRPSDLPQQRPFILHRMTTTSARSFVCETDTVQTQVCALSGNPKTSLHLNSDIVMMRVTCCLNNGRG